MNLVMSNRLALVVDDDASVRRYVSAILHSTGFQTLDATSGTEGLEVVQNVNGRLDLIISDIQMPNGDGISLACSIAAAYPTIPLLLISGYVQRELEGVVEFLQKPFLPKQLIGVVNKLIKTTEKGQGPSGN